MSNKLRVEDLLKILGAPGDSSELPQKVGGGETEQERLEAAVKTAELVAQRKICWCAVRKSLEGEPECPTHPDRVE